MLSRQLCLFLKGQLGVLHASCQQALSLSQGTASCLLLPSLHEHCVSLQRCSCAFTVWRSYSSTNGSVAVDATTEAGSNLGNSSIAEGEQQSNVPRLQQPPTETPTAAAQQPFTAAISYGPRKITPRSTKATAVKREGIVHVNSTFNNTIMVLTDRDSKVQTWTSGGTVGYKNANKATPMAAELAAKELAKRAVGMGFHSVVVKLKGMGKNKQFAVQSLAANGLTVTQLWDVTPIPYNGCRLPRRRRV